MNNHEFKPKSSSNDSHEKMESDALLSNQDIISKREDHLLIDDDKEMFEIKRIGGDGVFSENDESRLSSLFTNDNHNEDNTITNMQYLNFTSGGKDSNSFH